MLKSSVSKDAVRRRPATAMSPVTSSFIEAIGYDAEKKTIHVRLLNGDTYLYPNMESNKFAAFKRAKSKGEFFGKNLQKAKHTRRKKRDKG